MLKPITKHISLLCLLSSSVPQLACAEFTLNFQPQNTGVIVPQIVRGDNKIITGQTPYLVAGLNDLPELVTDPDTGLIYYHLIVGSEADGFIQETYIQAGYDPGIYQGGTSSAVGGAGDASGGNGRDPLGSDLLFTANAQATPKRVLVRQIVSDGEIHMEYLKDRYDRKALISQSISTSKINTDFSIDMRNSSYDDANTVGAIENVLSLSGTAQGAFDMANDVQDSTVTGGRYTYTDGPDYGGARGSYDYIDGHYDHNNQNWEVYFDINQDNPWAYDENKPTQ